MMTIWKTKKKGSKKDRLEKLPMYDQIIGCSVEVTKMLGPYDRA